jgi:hypothetical protein
MKCSKHPEKEASGVCCYSGKPFCDEDLVEIKGKMYGKDYLNFVFEDATKNINKDTVNQTQNTDKYTSKPVDNSEEFILFDGSIPLKAFQFSGGLIGSVNPFKVAGSAINTAQWKVKITSQRIVLLKGLVSQKEEQIEYYRVKDVKFEQTLAARAAGVGTIYIYSNDVTKPALSFPFINPKEYVDKIREFINRERKRMGTIYMEH